MNTVYCRRASREHIKRKSHTALLINLSFKMLWQRRHFKQTLVFLAWGDGINKKIQAHAKGRNVKITQKTKLWEVLPCT